MGLWAYFVWLGGRYAYRAGQYYAIEGEQRLVVSYEPTPHGIYVGAGAGRITTRWATYDPAVI